MSAIATKNTRVESLEVKPPAHPTYDLKGVMQLALSEDAGNLGLVLAYIFYFILLYCQMGCTQFYYFSK